MFDFGADVPHYPALFAACVLSGMVWPWPEDVPLLYGGMCVQAGRASWLPTLAVAVSSVLVRDLIAFGSGRVVGELLLERPITARIVGAKRLARARLLVETHGSRAVFAGRFLVGLRAPVFLVAGAMGVPMRRFVAWDLAGMLFVIPLTLALGFEFGAPLLDGALRVWGATRWLAPAFLVLLFSWVAARAWRKRALASSVGALDEDDED